MAKPIELKEAYEQAVQARDVPKVLRIINGFEAGSIPTYAAGALHFMCYYGSLDGIKTLIEKYKYPTGTQHSSHGFYGNNDYRYGYLDRNRSNFGYQGTLHHRYRDYGYRGTLLHVVCNRDQVLHTHRETNRDHGTEEEVSSILEYLINEVGLSTDVISEYGDGLPLHVACARHSLDRVKMVSVGCDVNRQDEAGNTPLHMACQNGNTHMVRYLVEKRKCDFNVINNKGELPLHLACKRKYGKEIVQLVSVGCDVNRQDEAGNTPLHIACQNGSIDIVRYFVEERKCDFNVANNKGELPLHLACKRMYGKEIIQLVSVGCDVNIQDEAGNIPLHMACQNGSTDIVRYLVEERKCDFNVVNNKGELPLHLACKHMYDKEIIQLVSVGCDVNIQDEAGNTPLHMACQNGSTDIVRYLVEERKCDVNVANNKGELPLHLACKHICDKEIVQLVSVDCDVNRQDEAGNTPLHIACRNSDTGIVKFLVEERKCVVDYVALNICGIKADTSRSSLYASMSLRTSKHTIKSKQCGLTVLNAVTSESNTRTLFEKAFRSNDYDACLCLMLLGQCDVFTQIDGIDKCDVVYTLLCKFTSEHGIACTRPTSLIEGDTILHVASYNCQNALIKHLIQVLHFSSSVANSKQEYPLHIACRSGCSLEVIKLLARCDINRHDEAGNTPLHIACQNGSIDIVRCLVEESGMHKYGEDIVRLVSLACDVNTTGNTHIIEGDTILHVALYNWQSNSDLIQHLITVLNFSSSVANSRQEYPLHIACRLGCLLEVMKLLGDCDVDHQDIDGNTPLHLACQRHDVITARFLMKERHCSNAIVNNKGELPLHHACRHQYGAFIIQDVSAGCDVNSQDNSGNTPLHLACDNCITESVRHLVNERRCDINVVNNGGELPLHFACKHQNGAGIVRLVSVGCDINIQDKAGNTPLHIACLNCVTDSIKYLTERKCSNDVINNKGELPLHLACSYCFSVEAIELVSIGCDVNRQDNVGNTPLHLACRSSSADVVKLLIKGRNCTVNNVVNDKGELPLHLACNSDFSIDEIKLVSVDCDVNRQDNAGNTPLHLACSSRKSIEIIKFLCEDLSCNPNLPNLKGERPLHLACRRGSGRIVEYFLSTLKVDVDVMDNTNCTPLMCTPLDNAKIVKLLIKYGADPQHLYHTYQEFFKSYSSEKPPSTPLNIIVIGNHATGKSTLIKALKSEGCQDMVHAEAFTAGIIPSAYESESFGSVIWYDLAGQSEYYASHEAILHTILSASPPLILLLVDIRKDLKYIQQDILYWLNFLHCQFGTESGTRPHLVIVLSFADQSPICESEEKTRSIRENLEPNFIKFQSKPVSIVALDCRMPNSDKIVSLRSQLSASFKQLCGIAKMNFILHCFYAFLLHNFKSLTAITISDVLTLTSHWISSGIDPRYFNENEEEANSESIDSDDDSIPEFNEEESPARLLPAKHEDILILCKELHDKGHIILLKNKSEVEKSWSIMQKEVLLNKVNGSLFAPQHFREHFKELSTNTGVVTLSGLVKHFPHHDPDMLIGFLTHMEFCQEINDEVILQLLTESDLKSKDPQRYFFFPGLVSIEKPEQIWKDNGDYSNKCGWIVEATQANEFFTPRFLQVLQLRIAFNFPLSVVNRRIIGFDPPTIQRCCSVWKNGISWKTESGLECLIEVTEQCQAVVLMLRSISSSRDLTSHYISYRSSLIKVITSAVSDICPSLEVSESFCHPDHIQYPPQECEKTALYSLPSIARTICKQVQLVLCDNSEHDSIKLEKLVTFEPFFHFNIHQLFNSPEKDNVITDDYLRRVSKSICSNEAGRTVYMMFTQEQNIPADLKLSADAIFEVLVDWRDSKHATYSDLHCHLSQYSIFCDRDPQVRMEC